MSWEEAQRVAEQWLAKSGIPPGKIKGQYFDLHEKVETLPENIGYRAMVLRAAKLAGSSAVELDYDSSDRRFFQFSINQSHLGHMVRVMKL